MTLKSIEDQVSAIERLVTGKRGYQLGSILLLADSYLVLKHGPALFHVDWPWAKNTVGIAGAFEFICLFYLLVFLLLPWIHVLLILPSVVLSERAIRKWAKGDLEFLKGARKNFVLNYAMVEGNSVVYQEYLRQLKESDEVSKEGFWNFTMFSSIVINILSSQSSSNTVTASIWAILEQLPPWAFYPAAALISISLVLHFLGNLFYVRYIGGYHLVSPRLFQAFEAAMLPTEEESQDEDVKT